MCGAESVDSDKLFRVVPRASRVADGRGGGCRRKIARH
jgi:hypothetical protein